jgi:hypothetical protein
LIGLPGYELMINDEVLEDSKKHTELTNNFEMLLK